MQTITTQPLTREAFDRFGDVLEIAEAPSFQINRGMCDRYDDLARLEFNGQGARPNLSLVRARPSNLPLQLDLVERHPLGSQAFMPLSQQPFLVVVADDMDGCPRTPLAFLTNPGQGINYRANTWHGVLTPLCETADFLILDRAGEGKNCEEYVFPEPYEVVRTIEP